MKSLEVKLFDVIQRLLDNNSGNQRLLLSGVSKEILMRLLRLVQEKVCVLTRNGQTVPMLLFSLQDDIIKLKNDVYEYNGRVYEDILTVEDACLADQERCCETGWAFGDGAFCTSIRNKIDSFVILSPLEEPSAIGSIRNTFSEIGLQIRSDVALGRDILKNDFFCQLLPNVEGEDIWGMSEFSKLSDIFTDFDPTQIWGLADALNKAATNDNLKLIEFEALLGLPYSKSYKLRKEMLKSQLAIAKKLLDAFSDIENFNFFVQRIRDFVADPNAEWIDQFEHDVKAKVIHPQYFSDAFFRDYSELVVANGLDNIPQWWKELNVEFLQELESASGADEQLCVVLDKSTVLAGEMAKKNQPIVVRERVGFEFPNKDQFDTIKVFLGQKTELGEVDSDAKFEYCATENEKKKFVLKFVATLKGCDSAVSHDVLALSTFAPGCYVTLAIPELLKKNVPFKSKGKRGKRYVGSIKAAYPIQNAQFLIFTDPAYELVLDSVKYRLADADIENELKPEVQEENQKYSVISELEPGGEISFCLKRKREKFFYTIELETVEEVPEVSDTAYQDGTRQILNGKIKPGDISYNVGFISSILSQKHMEDIAAGELVGYPAVLSNDIGTCFRTASFRQKDVLFTEKTFAGGDSRPSYSAWMESAQSKEGQAYFKARQTLFLKMREHYGSYVVEQYPLRDIKEADQIDLRVAMTEYLSTYRSWLESDYNNAIITDTFWGYTNLTEHQQLRETPDFIFLPPEHPLRLGWQFLAQTMIASILEQKKFSKMITSFDSSANPDYFVLPIQLAFDQKIKYCDFFSVKSTSDYWGVLYRFRDEVNQEDACAAALFSGNWGFEIPSLTKTITKGEVTTALNAVKDVCVAKDVLNIDLKPKHAFDVCNKAVLEWFRNAMEPDAPKIDALGPRKVNVYTSGDEKYPEAEIMSAREMSQDRLFWYTQKSNKASKMDVTIASLSGKSATPYTKEEAHNGIITAGGLLRYRTRFRGKGSGTEIVESRKATLVEMPTDWLKDSVLASLFTDIGNEYIGLIELVEMTEHGNSGYLKFSSELQNVLQEGKSYYYAFSSSDIDHSCFMPRNALPDKDEVYLWDYTLPGIDTHSRNTEGFFLLAPEAQPMLQSVGHAFESICNQTLDETFLRETLFMTAKRGIPTVKKLASGGTNAIGEVGTLIALNALQGNLLQSCTEGLLPAIVETENECYVNILVPMDAFRERFEQLCRETGMKHPCRPDIVVFSISCLKNNGLDPQAMKVSFLEVKARNGKFVDAQSALDQYSDIYTYFNSPDAHPVEQLAKKDFIVAMLMFGFRVYEALDVVEQTKLLNGLYSKVLRKIWATNEFLQFNELSRLFVVHKTDKSCCTHWRQGVYQVIELAKSDAYELVANSKWPDFFGELNHWDLLAPVTPSMPPVPALISESTPEANNPADATPSPEVIMPNSSNQEAQTGVIAHPKGEKNAELPSSDEYPSLPSCVATPPTSPIDADLKTGIKKEVDELLRNINAAFEEYKIKTVQYQKPTVTPNMILLDFKGTPTCTKGNIEKKKDEFASSHKVKILRVEPKLGFVRIYVEREARETLLIEQVWQQCDYTPAIAMDRGVLLALKEDSGEALYLNPAESGSPHSLIAGTTGSGKSVLMQNMLLSLVKNFKQEDVQIILIDPKQVDFVEFGARPNVKHCKDKNEAVELLSHLVDEMEARYTMLSECGAKKIAQYRKKPIAQEKPMPFIWVFHDEFADWFLDESYKEKVETLVKRLGVKARAAGIFLVFATQRPDKDVLPMQLRSNLGNKLILKVVDKGTSEIALGDKALGNAAELLGKGHMIAITDDFRGYCQVPFVSEEILEELLK